MWNSIDIIKLDRLLGDYEGYKAKVEEVNVRAKKRLELKPFLMWLVENAKDDIDLTDSIGVVEKGDFENKFDKKFVEENFEDLASLWFKGLNSQADFGIVLDCMEDDWIWQNYQVWLKKNPK